MHGPSPATSILVASGVEHDLLNMNPPHFHLLLLPVALLPPQRAFFAWLVSGLLCLILSVRWAFRESEVQASAWLRHIGPLLCTCLCSFRDDDGDRASFVSLAPASDLGMGRRPAVAPASARDRRRSGNRRQAVPATAAAMVRVAGLARLAGDRPVHGTAIFHRGARGVRHREPCAVARIARRRRMALRRDERVPPGLPGPQPRPIRTLHSGLRCRERRRTVVAAGLAVHCARYLDELWALASARARGLLVSSLALV